ncbi:hypothetical protein QAA20_002636 [Salmonella enterica]|nr:hypothetical protein [Salmonella enterica]
MQMPLHRISGLALPVVARKSRFYIFESLHHLYVNSILVVFSHFLYVNAVILQESRIGQKIHFADIKRKRLT